MKSIIEAAWNNRELLKSSETIEAIETVIEAIDKGELRVAEPLENGEWQVNEWVKKAVVMYFPIRKMETIEVGPFEFHDKMALKTNYKELGVRVVPHAIARYGAFVASGVIMMPSYINIGAFIGSRCIVVEGVHVGKQAVLGANVVLTKSTKIIDVTGSESKEIRGFVPERSVVIPGSYEKEFPAGKFNVPCALIIGQRKASTDLKTSLNDALREHNVAV